MANPPIFYSGPRTTIDSDYDAQPTDSLIAIVGMPAPITVTLTEAERCGPNRIVVKDESGLASSTNPITIVPPSDCTINGEPNQKITTPFGALTLYSSGDNWYTTSFIGPADQVTVPQQIDVVSVANKNNYTIPVGNMFLDAVGETTLEIDQGNGFIVQAFGADYAHFRRNGSGTPATVADAAIGFSLVGGAVAAGWTMRFRWKERKLITGPPTVAKVLSSLDYSLSWQPNTVNATDAIQVPPINGMQIEFWRESRLNGGKRGTADPTKIKREGRRYLPYFRGATNVFLFNRGAFAVTTSTRFKYRVCYYNPNTGARSALSNEIILACGNVQDDRVNGRTVRTKNSLWLQ